RLMLDIGPGVLSFQRQLDLPLPLLELGDAALHCVQAFGQGHDQPLLLLGSLLLGFVRSSRILPFGRLIFRVKRLPAAASARHHCTAPCCASRCLVVRYTCPGVAALKHSPRSDGQTSTRIRFFARLRRRTPPRSPAAGPPARRPTAS